MLLHAKYKWPEQITFDLWPFAVKLAADLCNRKPSYTGDKLCPDELFSNFKKFSHDFKDLHTFGCPVFVLDSRLQDGKKIPRWSPRARQGMYLGLSSHHSSNVAWVYNLKTKNISPQFHLVFDDNFTTCDTYKTDKLPDNWDNLYKNKRYEMQFDNDNKWHLDSSWDTQETKQTLDTYLPEAAKLPRESMPDLTTIYDTDGKAHPTKIQIEKEAIDQYIQTFIRKKLKDRYPKVFKRRQFPDLK